MMDKGGSYYIGRGNNVCKGFEAGEILVCLRNQKINVGEGWDSREGFAVRGSMQAFK